MTEHFSLPIQYNGCTCYTIELKNSFDDFFDSLVTLGLQSKRLCVVTDSNVNTLYAEEFVQQLKQWGCQNVSKFVIPAGEENKTLDIIMELYEHLILRQFDRSDVLIALGGGVTGDMTGYAAATYLRGIRFIQVPTTLLAMVDSGIGGKTGVDFKGYKNMVGAFHQPSLVYVNLHVLRTLDKRQIAAGMGEIIKHGLIRNKEYFDWLVQNVEKIDAFDETALADMIYESQKIKKKVVEADPTERGERAHLNFGHTIGHAIEKALDFKLLHGECVALGMVAAAYISHMRGKLSKDDLSYIEKTNLLYGLPVRYYGLDTESILANCYHDKKKDGNAIKFILLESLGKSYTTFDVSQEEMREAILYLMSNFPFPEMLYNE